MVKFKPKTCKLCGKEFVPSNGTQAYCGSKSKKIGCSYELSNTIRSKRRWREDSKYREFQKSYQRKWHKNQRTEKTDYAARQLEAKRAYGNSPEGRDAKRLWRSRNAKKILQYNKRRMECEKNVIGSHTEAEWQELKKRHGYKCIICGISESELVTKYADERFIKLTRDHIIPIVNGGSDYISNIQPLCVGCNARKRGKEIAACS